MKKTTNQKRWLKLAILTPLIVLNFYSSILNARAFRTSESTVPNQKETCIESTTGNASWVLDATVNNVECYYKIITCNGATTVLLKFNNKNTNSVKITWEELFQSQFEKNLPGINGQKELILLPGNTADNDCNTVNPITVIHSFQISPTLPTEIKLFTFSNVKVTQI